MSGMCLPFKGILSQVGSHEKVRYKFNQNEFMHMRACMTQAIPGNDSQTRRNKFRLPSCAIWIKESFKNTVQLYIIHRTRKTYALCMKTKKQK